MMSTVFAVQVSLNVVDQEVFDAVLMGKPEEVSTKMESQGSWNYLSTHNNI